MTNEVLVKDKDIVVPGELLAEGMGNLPGQGTYRDGEKILAARLGLVQVDGRTIKLKQSVRFLRLILVVGELRQILLILLCYRLKMLHLALFREEQILHNFMILETMLCVR
jgi:hypothetical protein